MKCFYNGRLIYVLKIPVYKLSKYNQIKRDIEKILDYNVFLHNADLKLEELYLFKKDFIAIHKF